MTTDVSEEVLLKAVGKLMAMPFYPNDPLVKLALLDELPKIVAGDEQMEWLIARVLKLYNQWPGLSEIRAVYCSKFKPRDGVEDYSAVFPDGIPSERPAQPLPALPPGRAVTADRMLDEALKDLAKRKDMTQAGKRQ